MLAYLSLSKFPKGLFVWIAVEGASASAKPFSSIRKTSRTYEVAKEEDILLSLNHLIGSHGSLVGLRGKFFLVFHCVMYNLSPLKPNS